MDLTRARYVSIVGGGGQDIVEGKELAGALKQQEEQAPPSFISLRSDLLWQKKREEKMLALDADLGKATLELRSEQQRGH